MEIQTLRDLQAKFELRRSGIGNLDKIRSDFLSRFPRDMLDEVLTLETYVSGKDDTFCYWVEHKTEDLGRMRIGYAADYGVYFNKETQRYHVKKGRGHREADLTEAQKVFGEIKKEIINTIQYAKNDNIDGIIKIPLYRHFKEKILSLYFPEKFLSVFSEKDIDHFLKELDLYDESIKQLDAIRKKKILTDFKNKDDIMKSWSFLEYMHFLYEMLPPSDTSESGIWLEKTIVNGRRDREQGDYALGKVLWSPQRDQRNADIYRSMRLVKQGDIILHLVDNKTIIGISKVVEEYDSNFTCLSGTNWDNGTGKNPGYLIRVDGFVRFDVPINREDILNEKYKNELISILKTEENVFYNNDLNLRQGAYLTAVPNRLLTIINVIFKEKNGRDLPYLEITDYPLKKHVEKAIIVLEKNRIDRTELMNKIQEIMLAEKVKLKDDWKDKTWENIKKWAEKIIE